MVHRLVLDQDAFFQKTKAPACNAKTDSLLFSGNILLQTTKSLLGTPIREGQLFFRTRLSRKQKPLLGTHIRDQSYVSDTFF